MQTILIDNVDGMPYSLMLFVVMRYVYLCIKASTTSTSLLVSRAEGGGEWRGSEEKGEEGREGAGK